MTPFKFYLELKNEYENTKKAVEGKYSDINQEEHATENRDENQGLDKVPVWRREKLNLLNSTIVSLDKTKLSDEVKAEILTGLFAQINQEIYKSYWNKFRVDNSVMYRSTKEVIEDLPEKAKEQAIHAYQLFVESPVYSVSNPYTDSLKDSPIWLVEKGKDEDGREIGRKAVDRRMKRLVKNSLHPENIVKEQGTNGKEQYIDNPAEKDYKDFVRVSYFSNFFKKAPANTVKSSTLNEKQEPSHSRVDRPKR